MASTAAIKAVALFSIHHHKKSHRAWHDCRNAGRRRQHRHHEGFEFETRGMAFPGDLQLGLDPDKSARVFPDVFPLGPSLL
jgi:hypothetical protein